LLKNYETEEERETNYAEKMYPKTSKVAMSSEKNDDFFDA